MIPIFSLSAPAALPAGEAIDLLGKALQENGLTLDSGFSVVMPDSFTVPFDAGTKAEQYALVEKADRTLDNIPRAHPAELEQFLPCEERKGRRSAEAKSSILRFVGG